MGIVQLSLFGNKVCSRCQNEKEYGEFYQYKQSKDGLRPWCKLCWKAYLLENADRRRERAREYRKRKPEIFRAIKRRKYAKNPEQARGHSRKWAAKNRDRCRENLLSWRQRNPAQHCLLEQTRRARKQGAGGSYTVAEWKELRAKYNNQCVRCGQEKTLTADHVIPISKGGSSDISNIQPLCKPCNSSKRDKTTDYR